MTLLSLERGRHGEALTAPAAPSRGPGRKEAVACKSELPALRSTPGTRVGSGHSDLGLEGEDWLLAPHSLHPSFRHFSHAWHCARSYQVKRVCGPVGSVRPWHGTPGGATSYPGLQTQLCPHVGALVSGTLSLLGIASYSCLSRSCTDEIFVRSNGKKMKVL